MIIGSSRSDGLGHSAKGNWVRCICVWPEDVGPSEVLSFYLADLGNQK